jgi:hypothetical protein
LQFFTATIYRAKYGAKGAAPSEELSLLAESLMRRGHAAERSNQDICSASTAKGTVNGAGRLG